MAAVPPVHEVPDLTRGPALLARPPDQDRGHGVVVGRLHLMSGRKSVKKTLVTDLPATAGKIMYVVVFSSYFNAWFLNF